MTRVLNERDMREIVKLRGLGYTQQEIGDKLGVTAATISYQLKRINKIARKEGNEDTLVAFLLGAGAGLLLASFLSSIRKEDEKEDGR